jgi:hypothetical protein
LKIKGKETKDPEEKAISSSQGIPSSFDWGEEGCSSLSTPFFFCIHSPYQSMFRSFFKMCYCCC